MGTRGHFSRRSYYDMIEVVGHERGVVRYPTPAHLELLFDIGPLEVSATTRTRVPLAVHRR
jgi:hypothetical protein